MTSGDGKLRFSLSLCPEPLICLWQVNCIWGLLAVPVLDIGSPRLEWRPRLHPGMHRQSIPQGVAAGQHG